MHLGCRRVWSAEKHAADCSKGRNRQGYSLERHHLVHFPQYRHGQECSCMVSTLLQRATDETGGLSLRNKLVLKAQKLSAGSPICKNYLFFSELRAV
jgi:hypothetical protein